MEGETMPKAHEEHIGHIGAIEPGLGNYDE